MSISPKLPLDDASDSRRKFVRNLAAIGAIAATVLSSNSANAAGCGFSPMMRRACSQGKGRQCFLRGANILTEAGERRVEDIVVGDMLPSMFGGVQRVESVVHYSYERSNQATPWPLHERPIRIRESAIAPGIPHRDLLVSAWHAIHVDGVLVPACNLVNGKSIIVDAADDLTKLEYFHVRLEKHDVIYADGLACESLLLDSEASLDSDDSDVEEACAPLLYYNGRKELIVSRLRSAVAPWVDLRRDIDVIRDRIEARAY